MTDDTLQTLLLFGYAVVMFGGAIFIHLKRWF